MVDTVAPPPESDFWRKENVAALTPSQLRAALSAGIEDEVGALKQLAPRKRLAEFAFFVALWCGGGALALLGASLDGGLRWPATALGVVVAGVALNASALFLHEGMHGVLFGDRRLNRWASVAIGATVLMSFSAYRVLHLRHHVFLGRREDLDEYTNHTANTTVLFALHYLRLTVGSLLYLLAIPAFAYRHAKRWERRLIRTEYATLLPLYVLLLALVPLRTLLLVWLVPLLLAGLLTNIRGFTSHSMTDPQDPLLASRSLRPHPAVAFLLIHENHHLEHHLFPDVPSYHLPKLHALLWPRLPRAVSERSYLRFLARFVSATLRRDRTPIGLVHPASEDERRHG